MTDRELLNEISERLEIVEAMFFEFNEHLKAGRRTCTILGKRLDAQDQADLPAAAAKKSINIAS